MSLCIIVAGKTTMLAASMFTLGWTHSVEKTRWEEDWRLAGAGLEIVEARVQGSGAGMEVPEGAVLRDGWWTYAPGMAPQRSLVLAASGATGAGWSVCTPAQCVTLGAAAGEPVVVRPCALQ
jgi:hypothetical protein